MGDVASTGGEHTDWDRGTGQVGEGARLGARYRLEERLRESGAATAWKATDEALARPVTVLTLPSGSVSARQAADASRAAARVSDPRLSRIFDANDVAHPAYIVTEWPSGMRLGALVAAGPLAPWRAAGMIAEAAAAVSAAHEAGLAHLCLTPDSLWCDAGSEIKITGMEIDAALSGASAADPALADTRGLARLLYAALTGCWPGPGQAGLPQAPRSGGRACPPRQLRPGIPASIDAVTCRALFGEAVADQPPISTPTQLAAELAGIVRPGTPVGRAPYLAPAALPLTLVLPAVASGTPPPSWLRTVTTPPGGSPAASPRPAVGPQPGGPCPVTIPQEPIPPAAGPPAVRPRPVAGPQAASPDAAGARPATSPGPAIAQTAGPRPVTSLEPVTSPQPVRSPPARPGRRARSLPRRLAGVLVVLAVLGAGGWLLARALTTHGGAGLRPGGASSVLTPVGATAFGPGGASDGDNAGLAPLAIDARAATAWHTDWYASPAFGNLQAGTGLLLDMGHPVAIGSARITLGRIPGGAVRLRAGDVPVLASLRPVTRTVPASGVVWLRPGTPVRARYLLIWFTRLPPDGSGTFQASIANVRLAAP